MNSSWIIRHEGNFRLVETNIAGPIKRISYPKFAPAYGLLLVQDHLRKGDLSLAEAADLEEGIRDVARLDGYDYQLLPSRDRVSFGERLIRFLLGKTDAEEPEW